MNVAPVGIAKSTLKGMRAGIDDASDERGCDQLGSKSRRTYGVLQLLSFALIVGLAFVVYVQITKVDLHK